MTEEILVVPLLIFITITFIKTTKFWDIIHIMLNQLVNRQRVYVCVFIVKFDFYEELTQILKDST